MRVVLDANLFVSAVIESRGKPARILDAWRGDRFDLLIRQDILEEIGEVLRRPRIQKRHQWSAAQIARFLEGLKELAMVTSGEPKVEEGTVEDPDDRMYLACAVEGEAAYVVSGDQHLLRPGSFQGTLIVTPAQFLTVLEGEG